MTLDQKINILIIESEDRAGLIHQISGAIFRAGCNIVSSVNYTDRENKRFYTRIEFTGAFNKQLLLNDLRGVVQKSGKMRFTTLREKRVVIFASKESYLPGDLLLRQSCGEFNAKILAVISDYPDLELLTKKFFIPYHFISPEALSGGKFEKIILDLLVDYNPEYLILANYTRPLSPEFIAQFAYRILGIRSSFLPPLTGEKLYEKAYLQGVKMVGASAYFVTSDPDGGPLIAQGFSPADNCRNVRDIVDAARDIEKSTFAKAIKMVLDARLTISENRTIILD